MYTVRILNANTGHRGVSLTVESYDDLSVALRVAQVRAQSAGVLALVLRDNQIVARYGLGENIVA